MSDENYLKEVREHYENYPYPPVNPEDDYDRLYMPLLESFDRLNYFVFEGKRNFEKDFRCLVAGGGTGDAIIALAEQLRSADSSTEVVYVDMSESSMAIAQKRAEIRGLTNITWIRDSLLNIPKLGLGMFDYVNCSGVLHHLASPDEGLAVLRSILKDDGGMGLMVYATYGRTAVYQMQHLLRILNKDEPNLQKRVDNAKAILNHLPSSNWFSQSPPEITNEVNTDIGIYDLLLHSQDRSYTVPELYEYLGKQGMQPVHLFPEHRLFGNRLYDPTFYLNDESLIAKVRALPLSEQQGIAELLHGKIFKHTFFAAPTSRTPPALNDDMSLIPHFSTDVVQSADVVAQTIRDSEGIVYLEQAESGTRLAFPKAPHQEAIVRAIDGVRTLREVFRVVIDGYHGRKGAPNYPQLLLEFKPLYEAMNTYCWMFLRYASSSKPPGIVEMQDRSPMRPKDDKPA